jgi:hypothetical protein
VGVRKGERDAAVFVFLAAAVAATIVAVCVGLAFDPVKDTLKYELWTLAIQALLLGAVGSLLGAVIQESRRKRDSRTALRDFQRKRLTNALDDLALEYRLIKRSRRMLRLERPAGWRLYRKELGRLEDLQRSLEDTTGTLEVLATTSWLRLNGAIGEVKEMTRVLDALWKEREGIPAEADCDAFDANTLTQLQRFIVSIKNNNSSFVSFNDHYESARTQILAILAELSGAKRDGVAMALADAQRAPSGATSGS